jgi:hypothetical protein
MDVKVLMARLAVVASLLLVPVVAVRVAVSSLLGRGVDVAAVLSPLASARLPSNTDSAPGSGQRARRARRR